jgi:hypothetical protein
MKVPFPDLLLMSCLGGGNKYGRIEGEDSDLLPMSCLGGGSRYGRIEGEEGRAEAMSRRRNERKTIMCLQGLDKEDMMGMFSMFKSLQDVGTSYIDCSAEPQSRYLFISMSYVSSINGSKES